MSRILPGHTFERAYRALTDREAEARAMLRNPVRVPRSAVRDVWAPLFTVSLDGMVLVAGHPLPAKGRV